MTVAESFLHPALFYRDEQEYLAGTVPFVLDGLAAGDPVAVAVPPSNLTVLRHALRDAADRVRLLDMTHVGRNPGRIIPGVLRAFADAWPDRHVRIIGEPIWAERSPAEYPACAQHEALINHAFTGRRVTILCPYDTTRLSAATLADARRTHPVLWDAEGERASGSYAPDDVITDYNRPLPPPDGAVVRTVRNGRQLPWLRREVTRDARAAGLPDSRVEDLLLALTELVTNSIEHAGSTATVTVGTRQGHLVCQVTDTGCLSDPLAGRRTRTADQERGRGLLLVNHVADLVRVHTVEGRTTIEISFRLGD